MPAGEGDEENMCGILNKEVFEINFKNLRNVDSLTYFLQTIL